MQILEALKARKKSILVALVLIVVLVVVLVIWMKKREGVTFATAEKPSDCPTAECQAAVAAQAAIAASMGDSFTSDGYDNMTTARNDPKMKARIQRQQEQKQQEQQRLREQKKRQQQRSQERKKEQERKKGKGKKESYAPDPVTGCLPGYVKPETREEWAGGLVFPVDQPVNTQWTDPVSFLMAT